MSSGAPTTTPNAYPVMRRPALLVEMWRSREISRSRPTMTNSVVHIANAPIDRAYMAMGIEVFLSIDVAVEVATVP